MRTRVAYEAVLSRSLRQDVQPCRGMAIDLADAHSCKGPTGCGAGLQTPSSVGLQRPAQDGCSAFQPGSATGFTPMAMSLAYGGTSGSLGSGDQLSPPPPLSGAGGRFGPAGPGAGSTGGTPPAWETPTAAPAADAGVHG